MVIGVVGEVIVCFDVEVMSIVEFIVVIEGECVLFVCEVDVMVEGVK